MKDNTNYVIDDKVEEMRQIFNEICIIREANDIYNNCTTIEEYEEIKRRSETGDEVAKKVVQIVTKNVDSIKNGAMMARNPLIQALYNKEMGIVENNEPITEESDILDIPIPTFNSGKSKK